MAKKKKQNQMKKVDTKQPLVEEPIELEETPTKKETKKAPKAKKDKKERKNLSKKFKEVSSELKKVSWPSLSKVVRSTGVVLLVVIICTVVLLGIDTLLKYGLYDLIMPKG